MKLRPGRDFPWPSLPVRAGFVDPAGLNRERVPEMHARSYAGVATRIGSRDESLAPRFILP